MRIDLFRVDKSSDFTSGYYKIDGQFYGYTLEDEIREIKLAGETCVPAGMYKLVAREVLSPMTEKYRDKYPWFKWHLMMEDVPEFSYCYWHIGNTDDHTDGCVLVGESINTDGFLGSSTINFEKFYKKVFPVVEQGEAVFVYIHDN